MDRGKLQHLISEDEGYKLDFKLKLSILYESERKELAKDVIAIANTEGGRGYIVFGVEDKTKQIVGIEHVPEDVEERLQQIVASRSMPPVPIRFDLVKIDEKQVGVLTIFKSKQLPHQMTHNGAFYIRRGSTTDVATRHEIAKMLQFAGMLVFEMIPCQNATLEDLDFMQVGKVLRHREREDQLNLLMALGVIVQVEQSKDYQPTYGGLLLFGKKPQNYIPQATLEVTFKEVSFGIGGNILEMLQVFERKVKPMLPKDYPFEALKEVVANALVHRDYWNMAAYTIVGIKDEAIEVENPSCYGYGEHNKGYVRANGWLYSRLLLLETKSDKRHFGIGLTEVATLLKNRGKMDVVVDKETRMFKVSLPGLKH